MNIQVMVEFVLKSGVTRQVEWVESNPRMVQRNKDTNEVVQEMPLTKEELKKEILRKLVAEKKSFVVEAADGKVYYVDTDEIAFIGVSTDEMEKPFEIIGVPHH